MHLLMKWLCRRPWSSHRFVDRMAADVARRSLPDVLERVRPMICGMGAARARGYVRARAVGIVAAQSDAALAQRGLGRHLKAGLRARATEVLLDMIVRETLDARSPASACRNAA